MWIEADASLPDARSAARGRLDQHDGVLHAVHLADDVLERALLGLA
jgi:hypothetical protein